MDSPFVLRRIYDEPVPADGFRVLVDRLWPRGVARATAPIDLWMSGLAPSHELRTWFDHKPERWEEFQQRYRAELQDRPVSVDTILARARRGPVVLVYASRDETHNQAVALAAFLTTRL